MVNKSTNIYIKKTKTVMVNKSTNIYIKNNEQLPVTFTHWEKRETTCDVGNPGPGLG
jgi:hypothetical protein